MYFRLRQETMMIVIPITTAEKKVQENPRISLKVSASLKKSWWHIHAHLVIFRIMALVLVSLLFLHIDRLIDSEPGDK